MIGRKVLRESMDDLSVYYLKTGELIGETIVEVKVEIALLHLLRLVELKREMVGTMTMRKYAS